MSKVLETSKDAVVFRVAELFFRRKKAQEIADLVNEELKPNPRLNRESSYALIQKARDLGFIKLEPPIDVTLTDRLIERFGLGRDEVQVVPIADRKSAELVAAAAADTTIELLERRAAMVSRPIGIGLGPGRATLDFVRHLALRLRRDRVPHGINLFAISAGCPARSPEYASSSFFNLFPPDVVVNRIGLFAETLVPARDVAKIKERPGVKDAFTERDDIDVVVTGMGDMEDEHDLLRRFLEESGADIESLLGQDWKGNVQYRPYSSRAPIKEKKVLRAVTLFELEELVSMAQTRNKAVVLIARICGLCGRTKASALRPLLEEPRLRAFSNLVLDSHTAIELLASAQE